MVACGAKGVGSARLTERRAPHAQGRDTPSEIAHLLYRGGPRDRHDRTPIRDGDAADSIGERAPERAESGHERGREIAARTTLMRGLDNRGGTRMGVIEDVYGDLDTDVEFEEFEAAVEEIGRAHV